MAETKNRVSDSIGFRLGAERVQILKHLAANANYRKPTHFMVALMDQLAAIDGPFDVRDIGIVKQKK